jgi:hypothetical protein
VAVKAWWSNPQLSLTGEFCHLLGSFAQYRPV